MWTNPQKTVDLFKFSKKIFNGKLDFSAARVKVFILE